MGLYIYIQMWILAVYLHVYTLDMCWLYRLWSSNFINLCHCDRMHQDVGETANVDTQEESGLRIFHTFVSCEFHSFFINTSYPYEVDCLAKNKGEPTIQCNMASRFGSGSMTRSFARALLCSHWLTEIPNDKSALHTHFISHLPPAEQKIALNVFNHIFQYYSFSQLLKHCHDQ